MYVQLKSPEALVAAMTTADVTVRELAAHAGVSPAAIGHLRTGKNRATTTATARKIAEKLDVDLQQLWTVRDAKLLAGFIPAGR